MPLARRVVAFTWLIVGCGAGGAGCGGGAKAGAGHSGAPDENAITVGLPADFDIEAEERTVYHTHGGEGALVDRVELSVHNRSDSSRYLRVTGAERLHGSCNAAGWDDARALTVHEPADVIEVGGGEALRVAVVFDPVECYNACDRFGFRVHAEVDGHPVTVEALLDVEREEPEQ